MDLLSDVIIRDVFFFFYLTTLCKLFIQTYTHYQLVNLGLYIQVIIQVLVVSGNIPNESSQRNVISYKALLK